MVDNSIHNKKEKNLRQLSLLYQSDTEVFSGISGM